MNFIIGFIILGKALICLSQSASGEGSVELPCGLDQETLDKAKGSLDVGTINLPILRCLCKLKISGSASGSIDAGGAMNASGSMGAGGSLNPGGSADAGGSMDAVGSMGGSGSMNAGGSMDAGGSADAGGTMDADGSMGASGSTDAGGSMGASGSTDAGGSVGAGGSMGAGGSTNAGGSMDPSDTSVDASASVNVGIDLNIVSCDGVANPDPSKKIVYTVQARRFYLSNNSVSSYRNSYIFFPDIRDYYSNYTSTVVKKMEKDDCFYFRVGKLTYGKAKFLVDIQKDQSIEQICDEFDEGTDQYNFLKILKYLILGGHDCPIEKDTTSNVLLRSEAIKIETNDPWPCGELDMTIDLRDKKDSKKWAVLGNWSWKIEDDCVEEPEK